MELLVYYIPTWGGWPMLGSYIGFLEPGNPDVGYFSFLAPGNSELVLLRTTVHTSCLCEWSPLWRKEASATRMVSTAAETSTGALWIAGCAEEGEEDEEGEGAKSDPSPIAWCLGQRSTTILSVVDGATTDAGVGGSTSA